MAMAESGCVSIKASALSNALFSTWLWQDDMLTIGESAISTYSRLNKLIMWRLRVDMAALCELVSIDDMIGTILLSVFEAAKLQIFSNYADITTGL